MSIRQVAELTFSAGKLNYTYSKSTVRFGYDSVIFPFINVIVLESPKYTCKAQEFAKSEWDLLGPQCHSSCFLGLLDRSLI